MVCIDDFLKKVDTWLSLSVLIIARYGLYLIKWGKKVGKIRAFSPHYSEVWFVSIASRVSLPRHCSLSVLIIARYGLYLDII